MMALPRAAKILLGLLCAGCMTLASAQTASSRSRSFVGFDRNDYPGDAALPALRKHFDFTGYWLTNPPGERHNSWVGKRSILVAQGFGFLILANGRTDAEIKAARKPAGVLGKQDAAAAIAAAIREHFPADAVLFLDQEEGGRLLPEQADYLFAWTEAVAASGFRPGVYGSGQNVPDGDDGEPMTTAFYIRMNVALKHLHPIVIWAYQDACPPSNGCTLNPPPLSSSGTEKAEVWQYAQSPRRRSITLSCAKTYAPDGNCYINDPALTGIQLDLNVAASGDPSHGR